MSWQPRSRAPELFGDQRPSVSVLDGGMVARPVPAGYNPPPTGLPRVEVQEPTSGWWQQSGMFGFRFQGTTPDLPGEAIPLFQNPQLPGPPAPWWVSFFRYDRNVQPDAGANPNGDLRGRVTYGVGGALNVIEVDLIQGIQFPIVASMIQLDLVTYAPEVEGVYSPIDVIVGGMIGKGAGSGAMPPTYTTPIVTSDAGTTDFTVAIPDFARSVCLITTATDPTDVAELGGWQVFFISSALNNIRVLNLEDAGVYQALTQERGVSIPAGTNQINVQGPSGSTVRSALQFFLAL
jgi:hypothetical protein